MSCAVVHCKKSKYEVLIDRNTKWGNPFPMRSPDYKERERVIKAYREWIPTQPHLMSALHELKGKTLGCWCAPMPCHGDVLMELANEENNES